MEGLSTLVSYGFTSVSCGGYSSLHNLWGILAKKTPRGETLDLERHFLWRTYKERLAIQTQITRKLLPWRALIWTWERTVCSCENSKRHNGWSSQGDQLQHKIRKHFPTVRVVDTGRPADTASSAPGSICGRLNLLALKVWVEIYSWMWNCVLWPLRPLLILRTYILGQQTGIRRLLCEGHSLYPGFEAQK